MMSIFDGSNVRQYPVTLLLAGFEIRGTLLTYGLLQTFINDEQKIVFTMRDVVVYGLQDGNPATSMKLPEIYIHKDQCHALAFEQMLPHDETGLLPRTESLAMYSSHYVIQGKFHMGPEAMIADVVDESKSVFLGVTDGHFYPLFRAQSSMIKQAPLVFIHRSTVRMHHRA